MSKIQSMVALSTIEVDYMVVAHESKEFVWLHRLCSGIGFLQQSIRLYRDS